jgi:hypothetical protein
MKKLILSFLLLVGAMTFTMGQVVYETFENGANLPWNADFGDGAVNVVENPADADPLGINPSDSVGSYQKIEGRDFSLLIAVLDTAIDLSVNNQFKIQVNSPIRTDFIMKLEGGGVDFEGRQHIAIRDTWIEYSFDFSSASDVTTIDRIVLFFDPGVAESSDTFLIDNIVAVPAGDCAGTIPTPGIVDDFECQRNVAVGSPGFLDLTAVDNPDPSGINTSAGVGRYRDTLGGFHALVYRYGRDIDLATYPIFKMKVWAPVAGRLLVKLEGGESAPFENDAQITELNTWVEYTIDFRSQAGASHEDLVMFFNAGEVAGENEVYFIDDIRFEEAPMGSVLEDFEDGGKLTWESLGAEAVFGTYDGIVANPDMNGNESANIGSYTKGNSEFGGVKANLPADFSLEFFPQLNLQVWAPANTSSVTMNLFSPADGLKTIKQDLPANEEWVDLTFNFVDFQSVDDFERVELIFDDATPNSGTWYFDNLALGESTVDPCEGTVALPNTIDDFDCQRNVTLVNGVNDITIINNPDASGINPNSLDKVAAYSDPFGPWDNLLYDFGGPIDLSVYNQLAIKIWSPVAVPMLFKIEGGTTGDKEVPAEITTTEEWVEYVIDFSEFVDSDNTKLVIFLNSGNTPTEENIYYIDDIEWRRAPYTACVATFETPELSLTEGGYFENGSLNDLGITVIENPDKSGANTSDSVAVYREAADGTQPWSGFFHQLDADIVFPDPENKTISLKVWMDIEADVVFKVEGSQNGSPGSGDVLQPYTTPGEWQELTYDFGQTSIVDDGQYRRLTLIMNIGDIPMEDKTYYYDDIRIGDATCPGMTTSIFTVNVEALKVFPNPVSNELTIENTENIQQFVLTNMLGQTMSRVQIDGQSRTIIRMDHLKKGMYILSGYDDRGRLIANARVIKE